MDSAKIAILLIDDDDMIAQILRPNLADRGYELNVCKEPMQGLAALAKARHQLVLLDVNLPGMSGFEVCRMIRKSSEVPIIMISSRRRVDDKELGFLAGADDYMAKPFNIRELMVRIERFFIRHERWLVRQERWLAQSHTANIEFVGFKIDQERKQVTVNNNVIDLTYLEFDILNLLASHAGVVFDRTSILQYVKGINEDIHLQTRAIDNCISRMRRKLNAGIGTHANGNTEDSGDDSQQLVRTVWGQGYVFVKPEC